MARFIPTRIVLVFLLATTAALCQQTDKAKKVNALPDLPAPESSLVAPPAPAQVFRRALDDARPPVTAQGPGKMDTILQFAHPFDHDGTNPYRLNLDRTYLDSANSDQSNQKADFFTRHLSPSPRNVPLSHPTSVSNSFIGRAAFAASNLVISHDEAGKTRLNSNYLFRVLASAAAHSASHSGKRSIWQPLGDFGSTIGNDAGLNVLDEFKPGLLHVVKTHTPKFVSHIEQRINHR
jgi:hypothetical protein